MSQLLPRYTQNPIITDPFARIQAEREQRENEARQKIAEGRAPDADPTDLRGIPVVARGVQGASPHTRPTDCIWKINLRKPLSSDTHV